MDTFEELGLNKPLQNAVADLGFALPTPIQRAAFAPVLSGKNVVGIAQTGTGKTLAYLLPILQELKFSSELHPRVLILVPTRELVDQVVGQIEGLTRYMTVRTMGIYGGSNINVQKQKFAAQGANIIVATPGRLYDLVVAKTIKLNQVKKLVIDEVDVMLDLGFRYQLNSIFDLLPQRRQNVMFSATMTEHVDALIDDIFVSAERIAVAVSGTPLENIAQSCYAVRNFYTKAKLLAHLIDDNPDYRKILVFVSSKRIADRLFALLEEQFGSEVGVIHANKSQNFRIAAVDRFDKGLTRVLVTTDVMARGLDLDQVTHVIQMDTPAFPENYMHRIGRTGRATAQGHSILFYTEAEREAKEAIEQLMNYEIPELAFPEEVDEVTMLAPEERPADANPVRVKVDETRGPAFHEKSAKNQKVNAGGGKRKKILKLKYNKPISRGDKFAKKKG